MTQPVKLLRLDEAAEALAVSRRTLEREVKRRRLRVRRIGRAVRVSAAELARYAEGRRE